VQDIGQLGLWDQLVYGAIKPEVQGSPDYEKWQTSTKLIRSSALTPAQLVGMALEMAREQRLEAAIDGFKRLMNEHPEINAQEQLHLCSELVAAINITQMIDDARSDHEGLDRAIALHEQMAGLIAIASSQQSSKSKCATHPHIPPLSSKLDAIIDSQRRRPKEVDRRIWDELQLNAFSTSDPRKPNLLLVESRSLPRSGHHFLKQLLGQALGQNFSYCEGYQEPGCCKSSPCSVATYWHYAREHGRPHLRLLKSHDFALTDATFTPLPGMVRLIQVRKPLDLLASWLELEQLTINRELLRSASIVLERVFLYHEAELLEEAWRLIDERGTVMAAEQAQAWLAGKVSYVQTFLQKWLPRALPFPFAGRVSGGTYVLRYNDLEHSAQILQALGLKGVQERPLPGFATRHVDVTARRSRRVTNLIQAQLDSLEQADAEIRVQLPALADGSLVDLKK
jgi:hypothetical protein